VEEGIYDEFMRRFVEATKKLVVGDPTQKQTDMGALISLQHLQKVNSYVELAKAEGGVIECGGLRPPGLTGALAEGYYLAPTIISNIAPNSRVFTEEIFGPVVTVTKFKAEAEGTTPNLTLFPSCYSPISLLFPSSSLLFPSCSPTCPSF